MPFYTEPSGYEHGVLSDLQGAWELLRSSIIDHWHFPGCQRLLFHVDEAMSWESVCDFDRMAKALLIVSNLVAKPTDVPELHELISNIQEIFDDARKGGDYG